MKMRLFIKVLRIWNRKSACFVSTFLLFVTFFSYICKRNFAKMREHKDITFIVLASVSISLIVIGFFVPPMGKIDGSVLQAAGIIAGMYALKQIPAAILSGKEIKMKYGNASMAIGDGADIAKMEESENE